MVGDEVGAARECPPFALEHSAGVLDGGAELVRIEVAGPAFGSEVGDFVLCEGVHESEVAAGEMLHSGPGHGWFNKSRESSHLS